ncbi:MAG: PDDEXK nuclease domain-containing protein [Pseudomonadota bacterium]
MGEQHTERELEDALLFRICDFLKELGGNFCFVDRQYRIEISEKEYFIDLLFYNRELQCLFAVELKIGEFKAEYASKMNMYLSALDEKVKLPNEKNSIGIIICKSKDETVVEYTLRGMGQPLGVSTYSQYKTLKDIPEEVAKYLPTKEEIITRLGGR